MTKTCILQPMTAVAFAAFVTIATAAPVQADPNDLPYGPDTCVQGYVWREARPGDTVCVTPEVRARTAQENDLAAQRRDPDGGPYGPNTCLQGFVWREAYDGDAVCVTPDIRDQAHADNAAAASRKQANADKTDPHGPNFIIWTAPDCSVVLDGAGPGQDTLNVGYQIQNLGPANVNKAVPVRVSLDSGATVNYNASLGGGPDGRSQHYAQLTVDGSFYQRDDYVTISADPDNVYTERVESDNSTRILIPRQPRPANSMIDLHCQVA